MASKSSALCSLCLEKVDSGDDMHNVCRNLLQVDSYLEDFVHPSQSKKHKEDECESDDDCLDFTSLGDLTWSTPPTTSPNRPTVLLPVSIALYPNMFAVCNK